MSPLLRVSDTTNALLRPISSRYLPYGPLDVYGALRLSQIVIWIASGAFDAPVNAQVESGEKIKRKKKKKVTTATRASPGTERVVLRELFGLMIVVFGGETFLGESSVSGYQDVSDTTETAKPP